MGFIFILVVLLGLFGLSLWLNGMAHQNNDGSGGGQVMVGGFLVVLSFISIVSLVGNLF